MKHNISTPFIFGLFVLCLSLTSHSEPLPKFIEMSQVKIGKPFPYKAVMPNANESFASQIGFYTFDASNTVESKLPFPLYQVAINNSSKHVYYVRAIKPFPEMKSCVDGLKGVANNLSSIYGTSVKDINDSKLIKKSGDTQIEATCYFGVSPYAELSLIIQSESQKQEIEMYMRKQRAR
ncbi:MAG: hypothetical protein WA123_11000 [Methylotenera sp.]